GPSVQIATFVSEPAARAYAAILNICVEAEIDTSNGLTDFNRRISARINGYRALLARLSPAPAEASAAEGIAESLQVRDKIAAGDPLRCTDGTEIRPAPEG